MEFWLPLVFVLLAPPAGDGRDRGACENAADEAVLAENEARIDAEMEDCAYTCLTSDLACARRCAQGKLPLTAACAACFGGVVDCTTSNCKLACMFSDTRCRACRAENCNPAFVACAGIPAR